MKGGSEKYAPVRAVPRWRKPSTNEARLNPVAKKPDHASREDGPAAGQCGALRQGKGQIHRPGDQPLEHGDLHRISGRKPARQVVVDAPPYARCDD